MKRPPSLILLCLLVTLLWESTAWAEVQRDRFSAGGYFRIMTRPDFEGGDSKLGLWNLHGRLLNEGPYGALEMKLELLRPSPGSNRVWTSAHAKIEGGSVSNADANNGSLDNFRLSQLYLKVGNVLFDRVTWQLGTLDSYFGDLGLYDMRPAQIFFETVGLSARYQTERIDLLLGLGDSGFFIRGRQYSTILTLGGALRLRVGGRLELGVGGQLLYEPAVQGNRYAPHRTPLPSNASYADFHRGEVVLRFLEQNPNQEDLFPDPEAVNAWSYKLIAYLGFGRLGPLIWNNLFCNFFLRHPNTFTTETVDDRDFSIYISELTNERYQVNVGNELQLRLVPGRLDAAWGLLFGYHINKDNTLVAGEDNRTFYSTVLRLQLYLTDPLHLLTETSLARENSHNGNLWRGHFDSIFASEDGRADSRGLEYGDQDKRDTWQLKAGFVLNPLGPGIYTRPSIRLLYGLQYSTMHNAFGNSFSQTLDQYNEFQESTDRRWHSVVALEAEGWF
jgi:hypothetical protein